MLDSLIEKHYKAYLGYYAEMDDEKALIEQEMLKDLYAVKTGEHPDNPDSDVSKYMAFWSWLGQNYS